MSKYGNRRVQVDGFMFDSEAEAARYGELNLLCEAGKIERLRVHPRFLLQKGFTTKAGLKVRSLTYVADFAYTEKGLEIVEDVKGYETAVFQIKVKLFRKRYPDIELRIVPA